MSYQFAGSYQEAQDLTQEIFVKLFHALPKYEPGRNFSAWLTTLAKNHLIDEYRRTRWEKKNRDDFEAHLFSAAAPDGDPEADLLRGERRRILWEGLNQPLPTSAWPSFSRKSTAKATGKQPKSPASLKGRSNPGSTGAAFN